MLIKLARNLTGGGKSPQPIDNAREYSLPRLDEQGASKRRIGLYLARWLGWATGGVALATCSLSPSFAANCTAYPTGSQACICSEANLTHHKVGNWNVLPQPANGSLDTTTFSISASICATASDTTCGITPRNHGPLTNNTTLYVKNETGTDFFKCSVVFGTFLQSEAHIPSPPPSPAPFAPTALLFALFASLGSFFAYRANRNKSQKGI